MTYSVRWRLTDLPKPAQGAPKVFSCFACGGGSSMGYKRAGFEVVGCCEIDPRMNALYRRNLNPKHSFLMDVRDFNKLDDLPDELYGIDVLDGSPPCSTFSLSGDRENAWGVERRFAEGQKKQTLDDLFMVFLDTVEKLRPKVVVAENVMGMLYGNARGYLNEIAKRFGAIGYDVQLFRLNAAFMDVPQARERVFFVANSQGYPRLRLRFTGEPIPFGKVRTPNGTPVSRDSIAYRLLKRRRPHDRSLKDISMRERGKYSMFNQRLVHDSRVCGTITAGTTMYRMCDGTGFSRGDLVTCQTFPQDYDFGAMSSVSGVNYVCGMSVPPNMMANIAEQIRKQWLDGGAAC